MIEREIKIVDRVYFLNYAPGCKKKKKAAATITTIWISPPSKLQSPSNQRSGQTPLSIPDKQNKHYKNECVRKAERETHTKKKKKKNQQNSKQNRSSNMNVYLLNLLSV